MSRYRRAPIPGGTYFFTLNTYRRQVLVTQAEVLTALRSAHRVVLATRPFRVEAMVATRSSMGSSPRSVIGRIPRFTVMSGSVCIQTTGRVLPWLEPKAAMVNLTNNPRAHSAPYTCCRTADKILFVRRDKAMRAKEPSGR